jgi:hypothetical protein
MSTQETHGKRTIIGSYQRFLGVRLIESYLLLILR